MTTNKLGVDIVYHGYFSMYEPYLSALIHIGLTYEHYPIDSYFELCRVGRPKFGDLIFIGLDEELNRIYAMGCKGFDGTIINSQNSFRRLYDIGSTVHYIDTREIEGHIPRIIYKIKDHRLFNNTARRLFYYWYYKTYPKASSLIERERASLRREC